MIDKLFSSKARVEILKFFIFNPDKSFYQREISRLTKQPIRAVQRELEKFTSLGLFIKAVEGNRVYYKINKECAIYNELKNIFLKSVGIAEVIKEHIKHTPNIEVAFIYGSYAKGKENLLSDIDLMIIGSVTSKEISNILSQPKKELLREINYCIFTKEEFKKRIKNKDHFLTSILKERKIFIIGSEDELKRIIKSR